MQRLYRGVVFRGDTSRKVVYLTFDDGPIPEVTPALLDILREADVKATFFMVADNVRKYPKLAERVVAEGHRVGNHTFNHFRGTKYSTAEYMANVAKAAEILPKTNLFRPPYGRLRFAEKRALLMQGYTIVLWDVLTHDYDAAYSTERLVEIVRKYVRKGSIINFHDSVKSNERMLAAIPQVFDYLKNEGYSFDIL